MKRTTRGSADAHYLTMFFAVLTVVTVAGFAMDFRPAVVTPHGRSIDGLINYLMVVTGLLFVLGHAVLMHFVWKYQGEGPADYTPEKPRTQWLTALIPVIVMAGIAEVGVLLLALPVWGELYGPTPKDALVVEVTGKQFEWIVRYSGADGKFGKTDPKLVDDAENPLGLDENDPAAQDDVVKRGVLTIPEGKPVAVNLRSLDVLHSFAVPAFRIKQDVLTGFTARAQFVPEVAGRYEIACAELCGLGHYKMRGFVEVRKADEFVKWLADQPGMFE